MTTASLELSRKIYELVGEYETEEFYEDNDGWTNAQTGEHDYIPRPNLAELIRILPKIGEKKGWDENARIAGFPIESMKIFERINNIVLGYMFAPTEPEGMKAVEDYLLRLL